MTRHPNQTMLALYATADLGWSERLRVSWHLRGCDRCRRETAAYRAARSGVQQMGGDLPDGLDWERLSAEMSANIRLGLAAGECVAPAPAESAAGFFRPVAAVASVAVLMYVAVWHYRPQPSQAPRAAAVSAGRAPVLEATGEGIEVQANGASLLLVRQARSASAVSVGAGGSIRARYIDEETGQVTIHNVYAE